MASHHDAAMVTGDISADDDKWTWTSIATRFTGIYASRMPAAAVEATHCTIRGSPAMQAFIHRRLPATPTAFLIMRAGQAAVEQPLMKGQETPSGRHRQPLIISPATHTHSRGTRHFATAASRRCCRKCEALSAPMPQLHSSHFPTGPIVGAKRPMHDGAFFSRRHTLPIARSRRPRTYVAPWPVQLRALSGALDVDDMARAHTE